MLKCTGIMDFIRVNSKNYIYYSSKHEEPKPFLGLSVRGVNSSDFRGSA